MTIDNDFEKPIWDINYYNNVLNPKIQQEVGDFLRSKTNAPQLYSNDIRHQYGSALMTRNKGAGLAKIIGDLNEGLAYFEGDTREDSAIDLINNEIGRKYGEQYPNISRGELLVKLLQDYPANKTYRNEQMIKKGYKKYGN